MEDAVPQTLVFQSPNHPRRRACLSGRSLIFPKKVTSVRPRPRESLGHSSFPEGWWGLAWAGPDGPISRSQRKSLLRILLFQRKLDCHLQVFWEEPSSRTFPDDAGVPAIKSTTFAPEWILRDSPGEGHIESSPRSQSKPSPAASHLPF